MKRPNRTSYPIAMVVQLIADESWTVTRGAMIEPRTGKPTDHGRAFCARIGLDPRRLPALLDPRRLGLTFWEADEVAQSIGRHPSTVWPEWADDDTGYDEP